eukprot:TRINITY_DN19607_c0_g1_i1.p1 TRINITY_DN19607_c0_g1~~TRINITY_DN19607_c0_g1_i1.p1  ORF type:complete len:192 (-),score=91.34 TRINITY_DN19607_c0_g1_i1:224-799(-)
MIFLFFFLMIRRPPRSTQSRSSAASDVYKRQAMARTKTRDFTLRYTEKAFGAVTREEEAHAISNAKSTLLYVPITSNRGSCGALNSNCFKYIDSVMSPQAKLMVIGKKGQDSLNKLHPKEFHYSIINDMKAPMSFGYASFIWANMLTVPNVERYQLYFNRYVSAGTQRQAVYNLPAKGVQRTNFWEGNSKL